jgi:hypothetical protein
MEVEGEAEDKQREVPPLRGAVSRNLLFRGERGHVPCALCKPSFLKRLDRTTCDASLSFYVPLDLARACMMDGQAVMVID